LGDQRIAEASNYKYLGIILRGDLNWADQVNYTVPKAWKALHFVMSVLINGNSNTKSSVYMSLARPFLEYGAYCWEPYMKGQINALDRVQNKKGKSANHTNDSGWETLAQRRKIDRICSFFKAYTRGRTWKTIGDRLKGPCYLSRDDHDGARKQRSDIGKYCFVNRTINCGTNCLQRC